MKFSSSSVKICCKSAKVRIFGIIDTVFLNGTNLSPQSLTSTSLSERSSSGVETGEADKMKNFPYICTSNNKIWLLKKAKGLSC